MAKIEINQEVVTPEELKSLDTALHGRMLELTRKYDELRKDINLIDDLLASHIGGESNPKPSPDPVKEKLELKLTSPEIGTVQFHITPKEEGRVYQFIAADSTKPEGGNPHTLKPSMLWGDGGLNPELTFRIKVFNGTHSSDWVAITPNGKDGETDTTPPPVVKPDPKPSPKPIGDLVTSLKVGRLIGHKVLKGSGIQPMHSLQGAFSLDGSRVITQNGAFHDVRENRVIASISDLSKYALVEWSKNPASKDKFGEWIRQTGEFRSSLEGSLLFDNGQSVVIKTDSPNHDLIISRDKDGAELPHNMKIKKVNRDLIAACPHTAVFIKQVPQAAPNNKPWLIALVNESGVFHTLESELAWSRHCTTGLDSQGNPVLFDSQGYVINGLTGKHFRRFANSEFNHPSWIKGTSFFTDYQAGGQVQIINANPEITDIQHIEVPLNHANGTGYVSAGLDRGQGILRFVYDLGGQCGYSEFECEFS